MLTSQHKKTVICLPVLLFLFLSGCYKTLSHYYEDNETPGVAVFSNTGNNVLSCFVDGKPWKTTIATSGSLLSSGPLYEVYITRYTTNSAKDTILITWNGDYTANNSSIQQLNIVLPVSKNSGLRDLAALQGKRIRLDSTNGYFSVNMSRSFSPFNPFNPKGTGTIYFNLARFDTTTNYGYHSQLSGIFDATIGTNKITSARFDDNLNPEQITFQ